MAGSTTLLGLLPTYTSIGLAAPLMLLVIRLLQGLSVGGEYIGSMSFLTEHAPHGQRGFLGASQDAIDAGPDHLQERVLGKMRITGVIESIGKSPGQADALIERADGKQSGIAGELTWRRLDHQRCPDEG
jgi:hypothetical protein